MQQVLDPDIGWATVRVLARNGVEVVIPRGQGCCGALALHTGQADQARDARPPTTCGASADDVDAIITNAAGCGSGMKDYGVLFRASPSTARGRALRGRASSTSPRSCTSSVSASRATRR